MALSQLDDRSQNPGPAINPARILDRIIRFWWVFVITLGIGGLIAFLINRYTTKIYPISASILMKESEDASYSRFLYGTNMLNPERNYSDQFFIMRSYPLIQKVVENLNLHITYYLKGDIKVKEWYLPNFPVKYIPAKGSSLPFGKRFKISFKGENRFALSFAAAGDDFDDPVEYHFNDTLNLYGSRVGFVLKDSVARFTGREYIVEIENPYQVAVRYSSALGLAWSQRGSGVIDMSLQGPTPEKEEAFLSEFIKQYQEYDIVQKTSASLKSMNFLDRQVEMIEDSLRYYETMLAGYPVTENPAAAQEKLSSLASQLDENDVRIQLQEKYYAYLEQYMNTQSDFSQVLLPSSLGVSDPVLSGIIGKLAELQFELRALQGKEEQAGNPLVADSKAKIEIYKRDIAEGIRSAKEIMRINRSMVNERINEMKQRMISKPASDTRLVKLQRNYKFNENLYNFIVQKRSEAALTRASAVSDVSILNNPSTGAAITPVPVQNYTYAIVIGILLPLAFFTLLEFFNNKIQSKEDIEAICSVPVIGTIGHNTVSSNLAIHEKPRSYLAESFRALRSNLNYFIGDKERRVVLVTSSISGEGKSFTSINLATVLAFSGKKTILLGGDLRKKNIAEDFGVSNKTGLSLVLSGQAEPDSVIVQTKVRDLDFIPPGPMPPNPSELFLGNKITELITFLHERYDYVIIDSPPVGLVSDALSLIPIVDHILFVTRQGYTPRNAVAQLQFMVDQGQVQHVSIVLNDIVKIGMGYGYRYGYAYDYGYGYRYGQNRYYGKPPKEYGYGDEAYL